MRGRALDMIAALHRSTPAVRDIAPRHALSFTGRQDLDAFLLDPGRSWDGGPFAAPARRLLVPRAAALARLVAGFDRLAAVTTAARTGLVITHGEPHPANLMSVDGRLVLIDWDTAALAPPERDLALIAPASNEGIDRYQQAAGRELDPAVLTLYRARWYLDDISSAVRLFRNPHRETPDTRRWRDSLAPGLEELPRWLELLSQPPCPDDSQLTESEPTSMGGSTGSVRVVNIRRATDQDWPLIYPFYAAIMAEGKTYPFPQQQTLEEARPWWMEQPPGQTVVAVSEDVIVGSAKMGPNRPGRGSHVATASFLVDPACQGKGAGRALGNYVLAWCRSAGFASIQFNAVVESNAPAVHLWQSLGFQIIGTVPQSFDHPEHGLVGLHIMYRSL